MDGKRFHVFLSHHSADRPVVQRIAEKLLAEGIKPFFDIWNLIPGDPWQEALEKALDESENCAVFSGPHGPGTWENEEMRVALDLRTRGHMLRVIPVLLPGTAMPERAKLPAFLSRLTWVDFRPGLEDSEGFRRLLCGIRGEEPGPPPSIRAETSASTLDRPHVQHLEVAPSPFTVQSAVESSTSPFLHNLPYSFLGHLFTGRQEELAALEGHGTTAITQSLAISGLGGIGKTRLAVEYAWRTGSRYTAIWFVRADSPENLRRNLSALGGPELLHLPEWEHQNENEKVATVKRWLREHPGWLLIIDNVDSTKAADAVLEILPSLSTGCILITSRLTNWPASMQTQSLDKLSLEEAVRFLLNRTDNGREKTADDGHQVISLAKELDGLPLALEQAAAFILRRRIRFSDYLQAWERERSELLKWHDKRMMGYPLPVAVTWQQTFNQLSPKAAALLRLIAFLSPDPIPVNMFEQGSLFVEEATQCLCEEVGKEPDELSIASAFDELAEYSMISRQDGGMVTVHRLVQEAVRTLLLDRTTWIRRMLQIVDAAPAGDPGNVLTLPRWNQLKPHVAEIVLLADRAGIADPTIRLMNNLGQHLKVKALYTEAEPWMRRALQIAEATLGTSNHRVAVQFSNLSLLLLETYRSEEAEELMRRALEIDKAILGEKDPVVASHLINLALILRTENCAEEAAALMQQALDIDQAFFGLKDPRVASDLVNLAQLLQFMKRVEEAEPLMRRALSIDEASFHEDHPRVARDLINLAQLLQAMNSLEEAESLMRRALEIDETSLGREHPEVSIDLSSLAALLHDSGRSLEAEPLMRRALSIDEAIFGDQHPETADDLNNLSQLLHDTKRLKEAEPPLRQALAIHESTRGANHPEVAIDLNNLVQLLKDMNRQQEAEPLMRRALAIDESFFGAQHPEIATDLSNLAILLRSLNRPEEAARLMRRALDIDEVAFGKEHPRVAARRNNLALLLQGMTQGV